MSPTRHHERANIHRARTVSRMLDEWDPIGVYENDDYAPAPGEYADLLWPIIHLLDGGADATRVALGIREVMSEDYGMPGVESLGFAQRLVEWHEATLNA